ncbi:hypothetical protein [Algoriphagus boritolerans]|uniref:DUF7133 domain-containing protein n=1 Tax=Algoriphagus boritolerans TaxID=308111 RepID=UPI000A947201
MHHIFTRSPQLLLQAFLAISLTVGCASPPANYSEYEDSTAPVYGPYRLIKLPIQKGVTILNPIQIALSPSGDLFGANQSGEIYTLIDSDGDGVEDEARLFADLNELGLRSPAGLEFRGDSVYVGTSSEIRIFLDRNKDGKSDTSWTFFDKIPVSEHPYEWSSALNFGPDGWLYFVLTTDSWNPGASPDSLGLRGSMVKVSPDGTSFDIVATGIRSVHGMDFNADRDLFFLPITKAEAMPRKNSISCKSGNFTDIIPGNTRENLTWQFLRFSLWNTNLHRVGWNSIPWKMILEAQQEVSL